MGRYGCDGIRLSTFLFTETQPGPSGWVPPGGSQLPTYSSVPSDSDEEEDTTTLPHMRRKRKVCPILSSDSDAGSEVIEVKWYDSDSSLLSLNQIQTHKPLK